MNKPLSQREIQIASLVSEGLSNKLIADRVGISGSTVKFHMINIAAKLGLENRVQIAVWFVRNDLAAA